MGPLMLMEWEGGGPAHAACLPRCSDAPAWLIPSEEPASSSVLVSPTSPLPACAGLDCETSPVDQCHISCHPIHGSLGDLSHGLERYLPTPSPYPSLTSVIPSLFFLPG